jgi:hypothetical protein
MLLLPAWQLLTREERGYARRAAMRRWGDKDPLPAETAELPARDGDAIGAPPGGIALGSAHGGAEALAAIDVGAGADADASGDAGVAGGVYQF